MPVGAKLVLEQLDPATNSVSAATTFDVPDIQAFDEEFDFEFASEAMLEYELTAAEAAAIAEKFGLLSPSAPARLHGNHALYDCPYLIHADRELLMMLRGEKPFAAFIHEVGLLTEAQVLSDQRFDAYVDNGTLVRRDRDSQTLDGSPIRRIMFARPGEEWRFDEYIALVELASDGWSEAKERREGELLGYTDWENDAHLARRG